MSKNKRRLEVLRRFYEGGGVIEYCQRGTGFDWNAYKKEGEVLVLITFQSTLPNLLDALFPLEGVFVYGKLVGGPVVKDQPIGVVLANGTVLMAGCMSAGKLRKDAE
jgi:hypothetical protein